MGEAAFRPELVKGLEEALVLFDAVLGDSEFVAGSDPTIADCCCIASVSTMLVRSCWLAYSAWQGRVAHDQRVADSDAVAAEC